MNVEVFEKNSKHLLNHCWKLLFSKAKEYATDEDRLANFKQPTSLFNSNPAEICLYWDAKHIASLVKMAQELDTGKYPTPELLLEKCSDYINYGLLFYSLVLEQLQQ